eukprot:TRINITY_DN9367_c0_g2_i2.p1 TRINITY_DN9367_c0_g2~~TRINITY_DN9367_c0_g2_i2.p1  ORF type:complete len:411 (+),score=53.75 TRINITY_DN9367_c0_g2_i2:341-1573(+)
MCDSMIPLIPGFEDLVPLAEGHAGKVFLAVNLSADDRARVVLKVFEGKNAKRNYETELERLRTVQGHPNVIALVSNIVCASLDAHAAIAVEYCAGSNLLRRLREPRPASEFEASTIIADTLRALLHIHAHDIIHRDVKPENIVLHSEGRWVLIDFDIACYESDETAKARRAGTLGFMAPEVLGHKPYDRSVDVFAVGALLFFVFRLKHPFTTKAKSDESMRKKTLKGSYQFDIHFDRVSSPCRDFISSLLQREPVQRPSVASALQDFWFAYVLDLAVDTEGQSVNLNHAVGLPHIVDFRPQDEFLMRVQSLESAANAEEESPPLKRNPAAAQRRWRAVPKLLSGVRRFLHLQKRARDVSSASTSGKFRTSDDVEVFDGVVPCDTEHCTTSLVAPRGRKRSLLASLLKRSV